jgi:hypothetical protein
MAATARDVAGRLEQAFRDGPDISGGVLAGLYADTVDLHHVPALPTDGPVDGRRLAETSQNEAAAISGALTDRQHDDITVTVDGDQIRLRANLVGTLADGTTVSLPLSMRCTIAGGRIVALEHVMEGEAMEAWARVAVAAGIIGPETLTDD